MSKGSRKRHRQISLEEEELRWELAFAATPREREIAEEALKEYLCASDVIGKRT